MAKTKSTQPQTFSKSVSKSKKSKPKSKEVEPTPESETKKVDEGSGSDSEEEEDGDQDDIDEAGMKRIMELLGDDGLDEFAQYQLGVLGGQDSEEEDEETGSQGEGEDLREDSEYENEAAVRPLSPSKDVEAIGGEEEDQDIAATQDDLDDGVDLEDISEVDEDAVPRQRLEYMNAVGPFIYLCRQWAYRLMSRTPWSGYERT
jgi:rRNA-processing protein EBP2